MQAQILYVFPVVLVKRDIEIPQRRIPAHGRYPRHEHPSILPSSGTSRAQRPSTNAVLSRLLSSTLNGMRSLCGIFARGVSSRVSKRTGRQLPSGKVRLAVWPSSGWKWRL